MNKINLCRKERDLDNPYEIWCSLDGEWTWRVLKKNNRDGIPNATWQCYVQSPNTGNGWEYGSVYASHIKERAVRVFIDPEIDFFADVRPPLRRAEIAVPNAFGASGILDPGYFPYLCEYFAENGMSFHVADAVANTLFFFSAEERQCGALYESEWGCESEIVSPERIDFNLIIKDDPSDPLQVPFIFDLSEEFHVSQLIRFIDHDGSMVFILTRIGSQLRFFKARNLAITELFKEKLALKVREALTTLKNRRAIEKQN